MNRQAVPGLDVRHLKELLFAAMLLAMLEGACVYGLASPDTLAFRIEGSRALTVEWTADQFPEYWLAGALVVLLCRRAVMLRPPRTWSLSEVRRKRNALLRLWRWTVALGSLPMPALFLGRISLGVH